MASTKNMTTPDIGGSADVSVIEVLVKAGDTIQVDSPVVTLESDKATMDIPATEAGVVKEVKVQVGDKVTTGSVLLTLESSQAETVQEKVQPKESKQSHIPLASVGNVAAPPAEPDAKKSAKNEMAKKAVAPSTESMQASTSSKTRAAEENVTDEEVGDIHAGPGVRRLARELGIDLAVIAGSGPKARILKEDVQGYVKSKLKQVETGQVSGGLTPAVMPVIDFAQYGPIETQPLSRIKKISGKNLQRNWMMIPHVTQFGEADISELEDFRRAQKENLEKQKIKLTPLVFIMKAVVSALKAFPHFNASIEANGESLVIKKYFHVGVAVDTAEGLVVPVIRDVDQKGLLDLAKELAIVSEKARHKQLMPNMMQGGCFSISSLGGIGGTAFTPIINYPEVAILGVSKSFYKPVYQANQFVPKLMLPLALSYDHRVIDGADGARFMAYLTNILSDIRNLLL